MFGDIYLSGVTPIGVKFYTTAELSPGQIHFWWRYLQGYLNAGSGKGLGWTIFGLSDSDFCHLTASISKTVRRSVTCQRT